MAAPSPSTHDQRRHHRRALAAAVLVTVLWSSSWVLIRIGLDDADLPPVTFAGLRYATAAVVLWCWVAARHRDDVAELTRVDVTRMALLGLGFYAVTQGAQFVAIDSQPAATTSLVLSLTPLLVAALGARTIAERTSPRQVLGAALVGIGAFVYFGGDLGATVVGLIAAFVSLFANAVSSLFGRSVNRTGRHPAVVVTAVSMAVGATLLLGAGLVAEAWVGLTLEAVAIIAWLAIVNTALAFTLWNLALRHLTALESAGVNNLMLVQIAGLAWVFLDEPPGPLGVIGVVAVSAGVFLTQTAAGSPRRVARRVSPDNGTSLVRRDDD